MIKRPVTISLFTGCGGLDLGFETAGFDIRVAVEFEDYACDTLRVNFPNTKVMGPPDHHGDISKIKGEDIIKHGSLEGVEIDMIIGGPPCQPFSVAAAQRYLSHDTKFKRLGYEDKKRGTLLMDYIRLVLELRPKAFLIENVAGIVSIDDGQTIAAIKEVLNKEGYHMNGPFIKNVVNYGVPQFRKRAFIIGSRTSDQIGFPEVTHDGAIKPYITVAQALANYHNELKNSDTRNHDIKTISRYQRLAYNEREHLGRVDRLDPFRPSKTVIAGGSKGGGRSHLHPFEARTLSPRESARLQTFPDHFIFTGKIARQFTQVGNAVPPLMGEKIAKHILEKQFSIKTPKKCKLEIDAVDPVISAKKILAEAKKGGKPLYSDTKINSFSQTASLFPLVDHS